MQIVLFEPEIPPNTGNIARLCAATRTRLNLIEPLGFSLEDRYLKRAGLDYWPRVDLRVWPDWDSFALTLDSPDQVLLTSAREGKSLFEFSFKGREALVFGPETKGLPAWLSKRYPSRIGIPIWGEVRSLNLSNAAAVCLFEAYRQIRAW
ncbi:MAG: tRNA (cytidine(34)-2'-O)-methyltransferase [Desulfohalobiaceae bacterium]|nr:tRNA (cytidine(34)-2'-O)-methyltransferase [Desulfohalobiaceae bacterium]